MQVKDGKIYFKLVYWGPAGSGKSTCLKTLRKLTQQKKLEVYPIGDFKEISMTSGATLYFDHGTFQSTHNPQLYYHTYTVAGQSRFGVLRKKVLRGADGIIVMFDSNSPRWEDCVNSMKELRNLIGEDLLRKMPLVVLLNKKDLPGAITISQVERFLRELNLWSGNPESPNQNPKIYETIALYGKESNIYESFNEFVRSNFDKTIKQEVALKQETVNLVT